MQALIPNVASSFGRIPGDLLHVSNITVMFFQSFKSMAKEQSDTTKLFLLVVAVDYNHPVC